MNKQDITSLPQKIIPMIKLYLPWSNHMPVNPNLQILQNLLDYFPVDEQFEDQPRRGTPHTRSLFLYRPRRDIVVLY